MVASLAMARWTSRLAPIGLAIGLGALASPSVDAAPTIEPAVTPKLTTPAVVKVDIASLPPASLTDKGTKAPALKVKPTPTKRIQEIVAERTKNAIIARGLGARTVVSPRQMYLDKLTFMRAAGDVRVDPQFGTGGMISMRRPSTWISDYYGMSDYVALHFRAAADKHYVVDCLVRGDDMELHLAHGNEWIGGAGTHDGDHRIAHLPKASAARDVVAFLFHETEGKAWGEIHQCEIIPLHE